VEDVAAGLLLRVEVGWWDEFGDAVVHSHGPFGVVHGAMVARAQQDQVVAALLVVPVSLCALTKDFPYLATRSIRQIQLVLLNKMGRACGALSAEDALRASIERFGVLVPITVDQHGNVLDGHHRKRIAEQLGVPFDRLKRWCDDDDERREIARTLNADRRQLSEEQRKAVAIQLRKDGHSIRAIAGALDVPHPTIQRDTAGVSPDTPGGRA
jgi:hypothetical protein